MASEATGLTIIVGGGPPLPRALSEIVAATLVTVEIYLARLVGMATMERCANGLAVPPMLAPYSVRSRMSLW